MTQAQIAMLAAGLAGIVFIAGYPFLKGRTGLLNTEKAKDRLDQLDRTITELRGKLSNLDGSQDHLVKRLRAELDRAEELRGNMQRYMRAVSQPWKDMTQKDTKAREPRVDNMFGL